MSNTRWHWRCTCGANGESAGRSGYENTMQMAFDHAVVGHEITVWPRGEWARRIDHRARINFNDPNQVPDCECGWRMPGI